jgi:outer membrane biogenesis lipoprotein LolB
MVSSVMSAKYAKPYSAEDRVPKSVVFDLLTPPTAAEPDVHPALVSRATATLNIDSLHGRDTRRSLPVKRMPLLHGCALLLLSAVLLLNGCAKLIPPSEVPEADILWAHSLAQRAPLPPTDGFSIRGSINYASLEQKHRVLIQIWGNPEYPVRADIRAGIGTRLAYLREDRLSTLAYFPHQNQAFLSHARGLQAPEIALPFSLMELSAISLNAWDLILPRQYLEFSFAPLTGWTYTFDDPRIGTLVLGFDGRPVSLHGSDGAGWELSFQSWSRQGGRVIPARMLLSLETGEQAIIFLSEVTLVTDGWDDEALELPLPPDAQLFHDLQPLEVP